jgi:hypothetical protein
VVVAGESEDALAEDVAHDLRRAALDGVARERSNATCGLRSDGEPSSYTNSMAAAIALENRNQDLANKTDEVRDYMRAYAAPRKAQPG